MSRPTLAEQLIEVLRQAGVERVYGVVGDSLNPVVDAIRRAGGIDWVHVRNEEAGAFAAAAEAQLTGRLAVCAGSCGPGNTHLIQGLYDAHRTGAPVLAIAAQIESGQIGTGLLPGDASRAAVRRVQPLLRGSQPRRPDAAAGPHRHPPRPGR
jgi:pyruvate dehydrogenase (quinone)